MASSHAKNFATTTSGGQNDNAEMIKKRAEGRGKNFVPNYSGLVCLPTSYIV